LNKLEMVWREIEYTDSLLLETFTEEELLDYLAENPKKINKLEEDNRYSEIIAKFKEGGLL
jgi:hypothetical protein